MAWKQSEKRANCNDFGTDEKYERKRKFQGQTLLLFAFVIVVAAVVDIYFFASLSHSLVVRFSFLAL